MYEIEYIIMKSNQTFIEQKSQIIRYAYKIQCTHLSFLYIYIFI